MNQSQMSNYLKVWDNASADARIKILENFIAQHHNKTASELSFVFANVPSLFFTRLTTWLRLAYLNCKNVHMIIQAINVFIQESGGGIFLNELVEVGVITTLLEILSLKNETARVHSLLLLSAVASHGRKFKELISEAHGIRATCECLATCQTMQCQNTCKNLIKDLSTGNPRYESQTVKAMISLLKSASADVQYTAAHIIQYVKPKTLSHSVIDSSLVALGSLHMEVQYECTLLVKLLASYNDIQDDLLASLITLLTPSKFDVEKQLQSEETIHAPLPTYIQQASSAKILRILSTESREISDKFVKLNCVQHLLVAMTNTNYANSQKQASKTLKHFILTYEDVKFSVIKVMGETFFNEYMIYLRKKDAQNISRRITTIKVEFSKYVASQRQTWKATSCKLLLCLITYWLTTNSKHSKGTRGGHRNNSRVFTKIYSII